MVIVGGQFEVDPDRRDEFIAVRHDLMRRSRAEPGCLEYTFSADPLDDSRVLLFERWESQDALDAHLDILRANPEGSGAEVPARTAVVSFFDATEKLRPGARETRPN